MRKSIAVSVVALVVTVIGALLTNPVAKLPGVAGVWELRPPEDARGDWRPTPDQARPEDQSRRLAHGRFIPFERGTPIAKYIQQGDTEITIGLADSNHTLAIDDPLDELKALTEESTLAIVVDVDNVDSLLSKFLIGDDWVTSTAHGRIVEVIKNGSGFQSSTGSRIDIPMRNGGGDVRIGGTLVHARSTNARLPEAGKRYLFFLVLTVDGHLAPADPSRTFELASDSVRRLQFIERMGLDRGVSAEVVMHATRNAATVSVR